MHAAAELARPSALSPQLAGRKMLPVKHYQKLRWGWGVREQANLAVCITISELVKPLLLPTVVTRLGGGSLRAVAQSCRRLDGLIWLLHALSPRGTWLAVGLQACQHGDACVEKVIAAEAERVGAGQGEMYAAQQNVEFLARLLMPWLCVHTTRHLPVDLRVSAVCMPPLVLTRDGVRACGCAGTQSCSPGRCRTGAGAL